MTASGIVQLLRRRGREAGIEHPHAHLFRHTFAHLIRHTFAHLWLRQGGGETDLVRLAVWKSRAMLQRYGARRPTSAPARPIGGSRLGTGCSVAAHGAQQRPGVAC